MASASKEAKPKKPRRPDWITENMVLVAVTQLANNDGVLVADALTISRPAKVGWSTVEGTLHCLEFEGHLYIVDRGVIPWTIILTDSPAGRRYTKHLDAVMERMKADYLRNMAELDNFSIDVPE